MELSRTRMHYEWYLIDIRVGEEVVHIEQDVVKLRAHTAVAKKGVNGIVPPEQGVAVGQCLRRLVVRSHTVKYC